MARQSTRLLHIQLQVLFFLTLALIFAPGLIPKGQAQQCLDSYQETSFHPRMSLSAFEALLKSAPKYRKHLEESSYKIVKVLDEISNSGITHRGVYRVQLENGKILVLKLALEHENPVSVYIKNSDSITSMAAIKSDLDKTFVIQNLLAEQQLAPKIYALLTKTALEKLSKEFRKVNPWLDKDFLEQENRIGILMEEIPDPWNGAGQPPINYQLPTNPHLLQKKIQSIYQALSFYQIFVADLQIFMSSNSRAYLADLDFAVYAPQANLNYSQKAEQEYQNFIEKIQMTTAFAQKPNKKTKAPALELFLLEQLISLHKDGNSFQQISKWLNKHYPYSLRSKNWRSDDVKRVLTNQ